MGIGDWTIGVALIGIGIGNIAILVALFVFMWQTSDSLRSEIREVRSEMGSRVGEVELEQARIEGANRTLSEVLKQQSHTHEAGAD